jgi:hypothetical protein
LQLSFFNSDFIISKNSGFRKAFSFAKTHKVCQGYLGILHGGRPERPNGLIFFANHAILTKMQNRHKLKDKERYSWQSKLIAANRSVPAAHRKPRWSFP